MNIEIDYTNKKDEKPSNTKQKSTNKDRAKVKGLESKLYDKMPILAQYKKLCSGKNFIKKNKEMLKQKQAEIKSK